MMGERRYRFVLYLALVVAGAATFGVYRVLTAMRENSHVATRGGTAGDGRQLSHK